MKELKNCRKKKLCRRYTVVSLIIPFPALDNPKKTTQMPRGSSNTVRVLSKALKAIQHPSMKKKALPSYSLKKIKKQ